jgi:hypothetical protein
MPVLKRKDTRNTGSLFVGKRRVKSEKKISKVYLVETAVQVDDDLASSVIIDDLEFANVAVLHHHGQELDYDLRAWSQQDLSLVSLLSIA